MNKISRKRNTKSIHKTKKSRENKKKFIFRFYIKKNKFVKYV